MVEMICEICGRKFEHQPHGRLKYCSQQCADFGRKKNRYGGAYYMRRKPKIREVQTTGIYRPADVTIEERVIDGVRYQCRGRCCGAIGARKLPNGIGW